MIVRVSERPVLIHFIFTSPIRKCRCVLIRWSDSVIVTNGLYKLFTSLSREVEGNFHCLWFNGFRRQDSIRSTTLVGS